MRSFLFTLKNPHGIPARKFALRAEKKDCAIYCDSTYGPSIGYGHGDLDLYVCDNCNTNTISYTRFATRYSNNVCANDTAFGDFLTGA
jgi:hypothetical protein